jgi:predicted nucleic acid-binding protein
VIVLDTTVLIDVLRGIGPAFEYLMGVTDPVCSEVTRIEVLRGIRRRERDVVEDLMRAITWVPVDEAVARRAGEFGRRWHRSHALTTPDLVIAATADQLAAELATSNVRHFPMFGSLRPPY